MLCRKQWILISWLLQKPADLDLHCLIVYLWFHTVLKEFICTVSDGFALSVL